MTIAGSGGEISFTNGALRGIGRFSRGIPRLINLLCDRALLNGYARQKYCITARMVLQAAKSLRDEEKSISIYPVVMSNRLAIGFGVALFIMTGYFSYAIVQGKFTWHFQHRRIENNAVGPVTNPIQTTREMNSEAEVYTIDRDFPYTIHVASFLTMGDAQRKIQQIKRFDMPVFISKYNFQGEKIWYRVLMGKFKTREDAFAVQKKIRQYEDIPYVHVIEAISDVEVGK